MELLTKVKLPNPGFLIDHKHSLLSIGSCFSENIGKKFEYFKFTIQVNPFGQQYNPFSIANGIQRLISKQAYTKEELVYHNELFQSFDHHSDFSSSNEDIALEGINRKFQASIKALHNANFLFLTFGTAHYFEHVETKKTVSNCHKFPTKTFSQKLATPNEIVEALKPVIQSLQTHNPKLKIIFTVSPVRYFAFGHFENSLSKAHLFTAIGEMISKNSSCSYFPAYEILMDELRDYRFYADDMLHPNKMTIDYVWDKMIQCYFSSDTIALNEEIDSIQKALHHRPRNVNSVAHQKLMEQCKRKIETLKHNNNIDFSDL
jgi:hypothetical protein